MERALDLTQQAIALDASLRWFHRVLGSVYLWKKQHDRALAEAKRAIAPHEPNAYATLAEVLNYAGQPGKALGLVEKALRLSPQRPGELLSPTETGTCPVPNAFFMPVGQAAPALHDFNIPCAIASNRSFSFTGTQVSCSSMG